MDKEATINNAKDDKLHNTNNAIAKLNINNNNSNTTPSLNSDGEQQSSQTSSISSYHHEKAQISYKQTDPEKDFLNMVIDKIHNAPEKYTLKGLVKELGTEFVHNEKQEAINILEAIYEALETEQEFIKNKNLDFENKDDLFAEAITSMHKAAEYYNKVDLLAELNDLYLMPAGIIEENSDN